MCVSIVHKLRGGLGSICTDMAGVWCCGGCLCGYLRWAGRGVVDCHLLCSKIAEAEAAVSVNEKKWLVMHMHVQLQLDELRGPQTLGSL
jgi:hypothetical protein